MFDLFGRTLAAVPYGIAIVIPFLLFVGLIFVAKHLLPLLH